MTEEREPAGGSELGSGADDVPATEIPPTLAYASPGEPVKFKTFRRMPSFEANLAAAKLEAAGVRCFVADENISVAHPLAFSQVRLQVDAADFERAEQILAEPASVPRDRGASGVGDRPRDDDDYADEPYRCPQCRRKAVDLLPLSPGMQRVRFGCLGLLLLPFALSLVAWLMAADGGRRPGGFHYPPAVTAAWVVALGVLAYFVLTAKRRKRCRDCGREWGRARRLTRMWGAPSRPRCGERPTLARPSVHG